MLPDAIRGELWAVKTGRIQQFGPFQRDQNLDLHRTAESNMSNRLTTDTFVTRQTRRVQTSTEDSASFLAAYRNLNGK